MHILLLKCDGFKFPRNPNAHPLELFCNTHFYGPLVIAMNMNQVPYHLANFSLALRFTHALIFGWSFCRCSVLAFRYIGVYLWLGVTWVFAGADSFDCAEKSAGDGEDSFGWGRELNGSKTNRLKKNPRRGFFYWD